MRVLRFSHDYLLNVGGLMVNLRGLNRELARCGVEVDHAFLIGADDIGLLLMEGRLLKLSDGYVQRDAMVNLHPCVVPNRSPTVPDGDSPEALSLFERDFRRIIRERRPDLVHVHLVKHTIQLRALEIASECGIATAMSHHEGFPETNVADGLIQEGAGVADLRFAITDYASQWIKSKPLDYIGFYIDTIFWDPSRILPKDAHFWMDYVKERGGADQLFVYPARFIRRKNHHTLIRAAFELKQLLGASAKRFKVILVGETIPRHADYHMEMTSLVKELQLENEVLFVEVQPREQLRALLGIADAIVYPAFNEGAGRSHLEGILVGACPIVADDAGLTQYITHGVNGLTFPPDSPGALAKQMNQLFERREWVADLARRARDVASKLTLHQYALDHIELYENQLAKTGQVESRICVEAGSTTLVTRTEVGVGESWDTQNSVLVIDLDYCIIRPTPLSTQIPSAFPLPIKRVLEVSSELGREYQVRNGLEDLAEILKLPWRRRIVVSMAHQEKVNEVCESLSIGGKPLASQIDAAIGKEFLKEFANALGITLTLTAEKGWSNPLNRSVRSKPVEVASIADFDAVKHVLADPSLTKFDADLFRFDKTRPYVLWIDDQRAFAGPRDKLLHFPVLPFCDVDDFSDLIPERENYSVSKFNTLDMAWRVAQRPFGFLRFLLGKDQTWSSLTRLAASEIELLQALSAAENDRQFNWVRNGSWGGRHYLEYFASAHCELELSEMRMREHAVLYADLASSVVANDIAANEHVLLLGRDMDYAYEVIAEQFPAAVKEKRLACLPLSRGSVANTDAATLVGLILATFPGLSHGVLNIFDVGFHGQIVTRVADVLCDDARTSSVTVRGKLLNKCSCSRKRGCFCSGERLTLNSPGGTYQPSRSLGMSIERLPHRTGSVATITPTLNGFRFHHAANPISDAKDAAHLSSILQQSLLNPATEGVSALAGQLAATQLCQANREELNRARRSLVLARARCRRQIAGEFKTILYPSSASDLLTPLAFWPDATRFEFINNFKLADPDLSLDIKTISEHAVSLVIDVLVAAQISIGLNMGSNGHAKTFDLEKIQPAVFFAALSCLNEMGLTPKARVAGARTFVEDGHVTIRWGISASSHHREFNYRALQTTDRGAFVRWAIKTFDPASTLLVLSSPENAHMEYGLHLGELLGNFGNVWWTKSAEEPFLLQDVGLG